MCLAVCPFWMRDFVISSTWKPIVFVVTRDIQRKLDFNQLQSWKKNHACNSHPNSVSDKSYLHLTASQPLHQCTLLGYGPKGWNVTVNCVKYLPVTKITDECLKNIIYLFIRWMIKIVWYGSDLITIETIVMKLRVKRSMSGNVISRKVHAKRCMTLAARGRSNLNLTRVTVKLCVTPIHADVESQFTGLSMVYRMTH